MADRPRETRDESPSPHPAPNPMASTGPTGWWRWGLVVLAGLILVLVLAMIWQGVPGTDVQPGTPTVAPDIPPPVLPTT